MSIRFLILFFLSITPNLSYGQYDIDKTMEEGMTALGFHDYKTSITFFNRVIESRPTSHKAFFYRAQAKYHLYDYAGCETDLSNALNLNPYYYDAYELRGVCRFNQKKYEKASVDLSIAKDYNHDNLEIWQKLVEAELKSGHYLTADSLSITLIQLWPDKSYNHILHGLALYGLGDITSSEIQIDKSLELDPYNLEALTIKSDFLFKREEWNSASLMLTRALLIHPKSSSNLIKRSLCKLKSGKVNEAISDIHSAIDIAPHSPLCQLFKSMDTSSGLEIDNAFNEIVSSPDFILGEREMLSDYSSRNIDVTSIYDILPQRNLSDFQNEAYKPSFHFNKGNELLNEKDYANAIAEYDNSIIQNTNIPECYYNRSVAYAKLLSFSNAIKDLDEAIRLRPSFAEAYYNRGIIKLKIGLHDDALLDFSKAGEYGMEFAYEIIKRLRAVL